MAKNSERVSLTKEELEKLDALYRISFGSTYNPDRTQKKLERAIKKIEAREADSGKE